MSQERLGFMDYLVKRSDKDARERFSVVFAGPKHDFVRTERTDEKGKGMLQRDVTMVSRYGVRWKLPCGLSLFLQAGLGVGTGLKRYW